MSNMFISRKYFKFRLVLILMIAVTAIIYGLCASGCSRLNVQEHFSDEFKTTTVWPSLDNNKPTPLSFSQLLAKRTSADKQIYIALVDTGYEEMAVNLFESSFNRHQISNYLYLGMDQNICGHLTNQGIECLTYLEDKDASEPSNYGTTAFNRKSQFKTYIVLEALKMNYTVILTDLDIVFLKDPTHFFPQKDIDLIISSNTKDLNTGFYKVNPTGASIKLFEMAWTKGRNKTNVNDQTMLNREIRNMAQERTLSHIVLDEEQFPDGQFFFEHGSRLFVGDNPCAKCVIVHNNWILSSAAKVYRFKEYGLWEVDKQGYYTNKTAKYLTFDLPLSFDKDTFCFEHRALRVALTIGLALDRIVLLPRFHCNGTQFDAKKTGHSSKCPFNVFYDVAAFDARFKGKYRENVFLQHHKVPVAVKNSLSPMFLIKSEILHLNTSLENIQLVTPKHIKEGPSIQELYMWFKEKDVDKYSVLRFHSLYNSLPTKLIAKYLAGENDALIRSKYRQIGKRHKIVHTCSTGMR